MSGTNNSTTSPLAPGPVPGTTTSRALERSLIWHAAALFVGACGALAASSSVVLALPAAASFGALWWRGSARRSSLPDAVTATRLGVLLLALAAVPELSPGWVLAAFSTNVLLDVLDGWVARRTGQETSFGSVFDREADAFFVLMAYLYFCLTGGYGGWLLIPGLLPYLDRLLVAGLDQPIPVDHKDRMARALAGLNFLLLLSAVALPGLAPVLLVVSTGVVMSSFTVAFRRQLHAYPLP